MEELCKASSLGKKRLINFDEANQSTQDACYGFSIKIESESYHLDEPVSKGKFPLCIRCSI